MLHRPNIITSFGSSSKIGAVAGSPAAEQLGAGAKRNNDVGVGDNSPEARRKFIADTLSKKQVFGCEWFLWADSGQPRRG